MRGVRIEGWRRLALLLLLFGIVGLSAELILLEHYEDRRQWIPLAALAIGFLATATVTLRPSTTAVRLLQAIMVAYVVAAGFGVYFHLQSNVEFELELHPSSSGVQLLIEALRGAMPALAPGAMAQLGLLGLLSCFRHPTLASVGDAT